MSPLVSYAPCLFALSLFSLSLDCAPVLPDVVSTWHAVAALKWLEPGACTPSTGRAVFQFIASHHFRPSHVADNLLPAGIDDFVLSLQSARDGTFAFDSAAAASALSALPKAFSPALGCVVFLLFCSSFFYFTFFLLFFLLLFACLFFHCFSLCRTPLLAETRWPPSSY